MKYFVIAALLGIAMGCYGVRTSYENGYKQGYSDGTQHSLADSHCSNSFSFEGWQIRSISPFNLDSSHIIRAEMAGAVLLEPPQSGSDGNWVHFVEVVP